MRLIFAVHFATRAAKASRSAIVSRETFTPATFVPINYVPVACCCFFVAPIINISAAGVMPSIRPACAIVVGTRCRKLGDDLVRQAFDLRIVRPVRDNVVFVTLHRSDIPLLPRDVMRV